MSGPLVGYKILEFAGIGPVPFAGMMLSDLGADVIRIDRSEAVEGPPVGGNASVHPFPRARVDGRGRRSVAIDLKHPDGKAVALRLVSAADGVIEGFRPGVMERLGLGPEECLERNPRLAYGRMTGWGQEGPYSQMAGHDLNYIALSGTLSLIGRDSGPPAIPLNLIGDYGGGGLMLTLGVVCAILEASHSGQGQVVDTAMIDGAAILAAPHWGMKAGGIIGPRGSNVLDGGAPYYDVYATSDAEFITIGSIEPNFFAEMVRLTGLDEDGRGPVPAQDDRERWPELRERLVNVISQKTRDEWSAILAGSDVCFAPVLSLEEVPLERHNAERGLIVEIDGVPQPAPAPRFSRTPGAIERPPALAGEHTQEVLLEYGFTNADLAELQESGAVAGRS